LGRGHGIFYRLLFICRLRFCRCRLDGRISLELVFAGAGRGFGKVRKAMQVVFEGFRVFEAGKRLVKAVIAGS
jgi:hypothetical protein